MEGLASYRNGWERAAESITHPAHARAEIKGEPHRNTTRWLHPHKLQQMLRKAATVVAQTVTRKAVTLTS